MTTDEHIKPGEVDERDLLPDEFTYEMRKADADYQRYLQRRGITAREHEREIGEWLDVQD